MYGIDEYRQVVGVNIWRDAVTEIEHVSGPGSVTRQDIGDTLSNDFG